MSKLTKLTLAGILAMCTTSCRDESLPKPKREMFVCNQLDVAGSLAFPIAYKHQFTFPFMELYLVDSNCDGNIDTIGRHGVAEFVVNDYNGPMIEHNGTLELTPEMRVKANKIAQANRELLYDIAQSLYDQQQKEPK